MVLGWQEWGEDYLFNEDNDGSSMPWVLLAVVPQAWLEEWEEEAGRRGQEPLARIYALCRRNLAK